MTVIWFWVKVPVLSEQITVVEPSVSTDDRRRISAWRAIISRMPNARVTVTTAGKPSGTAATARLTAMMNISSGGTPRSQPTRKTTPQMANVPQPSAFPSWFNRLCSGVSSCCTDCSIVAISPICVSMPVLTTAPRPRP